MNYCYHRTIADQFYYNVRDVRTKDDTVLTVKLMIFFELVNLNQMLDSTVDPIADFINSVASDTVAFVSGLTYEVRRVVRPELYWKQSWALAVFF